MMKTYKYMLLGLILINRQICSLKTHKLNEKLKTQTFIIHYDNSSIGTIDFLFKTTFIQQQPTVLFNYDHRITPRHCCGHFSDSVINLVVLHDIEKFELQFAAVEGNLKQHDVVLQVSNNSYDVQSLIVNPQTTVQYVYVINDDDIYNITPTKLNILRVGYASCNPLVYLAVEDGNEFVKGPEHKIVDLVAKVLHSTMIIHHYDFNYSRNDVIKLVRNGELDFVGGCLSYSMERRKLVDFTPDFLADGYKVVYSTLSLTKHKPFLIYTPFNIFVWFFVILVPLGIGVSLVKGFNHYKMKTNFNIFIFLQVLLEQPPKVKRLHWFVEVIWVLWLFGAMIISNTYKSKLSATIIAPQLNEPENILDVIDRNYELYMPHPDASFPTEKINGSLNIKIRNVVLTWKRNYNYCDAINSTYYGTNAVLLEMMNGKFRFWNYCQKYFTKAQRDSLRASKEYIFHSGHAWALKYHSRVNKKMIFALELLKSYGLIKYWYSAYNATREITHANSVSSHDPTSLDINVFFSHFVMLVTGLGSSIIVFFIELIVSQLQQ